MLFYVCDHRSGPAEDQHSPRVFDNTPLKIIFVINQQETTGGNVIRMICIIFVLNQQEATGGNIIRMIYIISVLNQQEATGGNVIRMI